MAAHTQLRHFSDELKRPLQQALILTVVGLVMQCLTIVYGVHQLKEKDARISLLSQKIIANDQEKVGLQHSVDMLLENFDSLVQDRLTVRATPIKQELQGNGAEYKYTVYKYTVSLDLPPVVMKTIRDAEFEAPLENNMRGLNEFSASYNAASCLKNVNIKIELMNGRKRTLSFNMCKQVP